MSAEREQATAYPLTWPTGWRRTPAGERRRARFGHRQGYGLQSLTVGQAIDRLATELRRLDAGHEVLSTHVRLRLDGIPRSDQPEPADPGAAVYFKLKGKPRVLACDKWDRVADNIAALAMHIEAVRAVDRYGVGTLEQAFAGYAALPPAAAVDWHVVLGLPPDATLDQVEAAYQRLAKVHHPDLGGDPDQMARLNISRQAARVALGT